MGSVDTEKIEAKLELGSETETSIECLIYKLNFEQPFSEIIYFYLDMENPNHILL